MIDPEVFAKENGIQTDEVDGYTAGAGWPCTSIYYEPSSVITLVEKLKGELHSLNHKIEVACDLIPNLDEILEEVE